MDIDVIPFANYSNYYTFLKVMTWNATTKDVFKITAHEVRKTELMLVRLVQMTAFAEDVLLVREGKELSNRSSLFDLTPVIDDEGILRVGGRIDHAESLPMYTRRPIIMPRDHPMSRLITRHYHEMYYHQNQESIICAIRSKYWITNIRGLLKSVKRECQHCKNMGATPKTPLMGQIPEDRLTPYIRPFSYTGLDYFGPIMVSIGRRREKRWVALFTCLTIRAIHLEVARDLSTDAVILCLRNFVNRRGIPVRLRSDRGTNFVGASKVEWICLKNDLEAECTRRGIEWVFNSPANPSAGGAWERMVRSVKRVLSFTLKEAAPQIETLQSLLIEAENLINSRPLTHIPIESVDSDPLTPNHFILGCPNYIQTSDCSKAVCLRKQWRVVQQLKQTFWRRWMLEYLPTLTRRTKWHQRVKPIAIGDVVIICDDNESRGEWKRGIVLEVYPAPDGQVRSALVKTSSGNLRRPASKLAVLDVYGEPQTADAPSVHGGRNVVESTTL
ncbi:PREDICTED: uncharacterized protein LOC108361294 [Rhagoletis zephyria]|uniref:uncharacterized protein LOC108361294 n=1 Tax=Rhagoletis zephyria TaxID=28612 RepID=UPI0008112310|nr:PREDICTED: uncharacterized protein LOC108361294 [Rhagoletis zephyria]